MYALNEFANDGHCYAGRGALIEKAVTILGVDTDILFGTVEKMLAERDLIPEQPDRVFLPPLWFSEKGVAQRLLQILYSRRNSPVTNIDAVIARAESSAGISYDEIQRAAIRTASESKIMILTGGPGVGKTTTTKGIISVFAEQGLTVLLAAPTGRAAKRLSETSGREAKTIHRLLESAPPGGYARNADNPIEGDVLIVDECSMIDIVLMYNLLKAVPDDMAVVFVGDADQLPSVGSGNVLRDMISSGALPVVRLTTIYRQAQSSMIITNAHRINRGEFPVLKGGKLSDFFFVEEENPANIPVIICGLCTKRLPGYYSVDPVQDIQILTPMRRGETGAANLNVLLQNALNPSGESLNRGGTEYRLRDKVMQIKNDYDKDVFNGDIGIVTSLDLEERELTVTFDGRAVKYDVSELDELVLAYATTIHKAQGSEYPIVVMPFTMQHFMMLQRNLLYTGLTRAKKVFVLVGTKKAIGYAVRNDKVAERNTMLAERLGGGQPGLR
jgi:exodeoxyribonuclease V alpha subunit